ncbi:PREDICTED: uncharacterized protein LOC107349914 [Acropora digitifera]|uniref:uncharacterized protein LOC107349914 n=1 Tax=Acropora digitifera TaxID=70779 RepID=UPI00077AC2B7|nr:PREDICTED: uncharacterized protein LOC107349914 [Acropora digitifera]
MQAMSKSLRSENSFVEITNIQKPSVDRSESRRADPKMTSFNSAGSKLVNRLTMHDLKTVQDAFMINQSGHERELSLDVDQFCEILSIVLNKGSQEEYEDLFNKIDVGKEGYVDWDKFCSHMLLEYYEKDDRMKTTQVFVIKKNLNFSLFRNNPNNVNEAILVFGDVQGHVNALLFSAATMALFDRPAQPAGSKQDVCLNVNIQDVNRGFYKNARFVKHQGHTEWARQVMYSAHLDCFISCATNYKNSLVLGWIEKSKMNMRTTEFKIPQGVNAFDYSERINLIATAGVNHHVCLWNPYVISKPVGVLRGHMQSVISVRFIESRGQLISLSKDKVLRIWDTHLQVCLQRLSGMFPKGPAEVSITMYYDEEHSKLFTAFNQQLTLMVMKPEVKDRVMSHDHPVSGAIYNSKFNQVVSAGSGSVITMWMIETGQKVKQFANAHGNSEITTLTQDSTETRLLTASADGTVKVWPCAMQTKNFPSLHVIIHFIALGNLKLQYINGWQRFTCGDQPSAVFEEDYHSCRMGQNCVCVPRFTAQLILRLSVRVERKTALVKQFQPHSDTINSIQLFTRSERLLVLTASSDCSVALWDIEGRHIGIFGQDKKNETQLHMIAIAGKAYQEKRIEKRERRQPQSIPDMPYLNWEKTGQAPAGPYAV